MGPLYLVPPSQNMDKLIEICQTSLVWFLLNFIWQAVLLNTLPKLRKKMHILSFLFHFCLAACPGMLLEKPVNHILKEAWPLFTFVTLPILMPDLFCHIFSQLINEIGQFPLSSYHGKFAVNGLVLFL